jgi:hypothetical protein
MNLRAYQLARRGSTCLLGVLLACGGLATRALAGEVRSASDALEQDIIAKLVERNRWREQHLQEYSVARHYRIRSDSGETRAEAQVMLQYRAPDTKEFKTVSENGSMIGNMVFRQMQEGETDSFKRHLSLSPENYEFGLVREETLNGQRCFVFNVKPRRQDPLLFEGQIWVQDQEFAVVKIAGRPVKSPSWWIKSSSFVRYYDKVGDFWLPVRDETVSQVRLWGTNTLTVEYGNYRVVPGVEGATAQVSQPPSQPQAAPPPVRPRRVATKGGTQD